MSPTPGTLSASIVLCTKERACDVAKCLDSLRAQTRIPEQLIVVDSGSDDTESHVRAFARDVTSTEVVYLRSEPGLTLQRNAGIRAAAMDVLHFFDDDCTLEPEYIDEMQNVFESSPDVLGAGPRLLLPYSPSLPGKFWRKLFLLPDTAGSGRIQPSGFGTYTWFSHIDSPHDVEVLCGCCAFRRSVFDTHMFDEHFSGYGYLEDLEFSYRMGRHGRLVCNPRARITHWESPSARIDWRRLAAMQIVNHAYVFRKHLPQDVYHRACFWWSEFGEALRRAATAVKLGDPNVIWGMIDGYRQIVRTPRGDD
jgi:GT2 family glycosyltransferase